MDVHRARFVPFPVHSITAVAFSRTTEETSLPAGLPQPTLRLALGRDNGQIEIWNALGGRWVQETIILSGDKSVDGLVWTREADEIAVQGQPIMGQYRLFSIASSPHVLEWDLKRGDLKKKSTGNFSEVWCVAAQPRQQHHEEGKNESTSRSQDLVAGCGDGTIALLSTSDNDVQFQRFLARISSKKAKCISITYQNRHRIVAGFADGNIRVIDTRNGSIVRTMSLGVGLPPAPRNKFVWKVKCLPNGDIMSGDSNGEVAFWDGRSYSLNQKIKAHESDCVDIVTGADGKTVFTGSLDGRIAVYHNITNANGRRSWAKTQHRRVHPKSEVKAMAAYDGSDMSVVVSGGSDLVPEVLPLKDYGKENFRSLPHLPQFRSPVISARRARLLVSWWDNAVSIWRIARPHDIAQPPRKLVGKLILRSKEAIRSVAISNDGKVLAAGTDSELKVFQLRRITETEKLDFKPLTLPVDLASSGARLVSFSPDGRWLAIADLDNEVHVLRLAQDVAKPRRMIIVNKAVELERQHRSANFESAYASYEEAISRLAFSTDGHVLVASDLSGRLESWILEGREDLTAPQLDVTIDDSRKDNSDDSSSGSSEDDDDDRLCIFYGQHWTNNPSAHLLPKLDSAPIVLTFRPLPTSNSREGVNGNPGVHSTRSNPHAHSHQLPRGPYRLWVMTVKHQMYEFDVLEGRLTEWSRRNPTSALPEDLVKQRDRALGAIWDVSQSKERLWLFGSSWLFMLNVAKDLQPPNVKRRRRSSHGGSSDGRDTKVLKVDRGAPFFRDGLPGRVARLEDGVSVNVDLDRQVRSEQTDEDDTANSDRDLQLTRLRSLDDDEQTTPFESFQPEERRWWCTFKYRPVLGMVELEDDVDMGPEDGKHVEVAIVERPIWDVQEELVKGAK